MKKTAKTSQRNKKITSSTEIGDRATTEIYDQYVNYKTNKTVYTTRSWAEKTGKDLIAYCLRKDSLRIPPFHYAMGITSKVWEKLVKIYPELQLYLEEAKDILGEKRIKGGLGFGDERKLDSGMISFVQHQYHADWKEAEEYHDSRDKSKIEARAKASKEAEGKGDTEIHVHMDRYISDIVPDKKKENNED